jgi:fatty-acyl-CoA synthase
MMLTMSHAAGPNEPEVRDLTLGELLQWAAETTPDRIALIAGVPAPENRRQWTYAELYAQSLRTARALRSRFEPGERVAIWAHNIPEWIMMEFGAAMAGVILVTVNPGLRSGEVEYTLKQSRAAGLLVVSEFRGNPMLATAEGLKPRCPELREIICFDQWDEFLGSGDIANPKLPAVRSTDPVMIQYTSGTTGFPKGALLHHRGLGNNGAHTADRAGIADGSVQITTMPLFHTGGCVCCVLGAVSTMLVAMMEHASFAAADLSSLKAIYSGGSTVPAAIVTALEQKLGAPFTIVFGQTECSPVALMTWTTDTIADKANTIGTPMPNVEVKIVNPDNGQTVAAGEIGEICTRGYHVMHGYFENAAATAAAIDSDGWLHTGDLGAMDGRGYCTVEGRLKDMIIRGGENIYPRELEELLFRHPSVGDIAVVGLPDPKWGEVVAAFIRPAPGGKIEKEELHNYLREHLAPHKTPRHWFVVDAMPLTGSGKIQKFKLREQWSKGEMREL